MTILCFRGHIFDIKSVYENVNYSFRGHFWKLHFQNQTPSGFKNITL